MGLFAAHAGHLTWTRYRRIVADASMVHRSACLLCLREMLRPLHASLIWVKGTAPRAALKFVLDP